MKIVKLWEIPMISHELEDDFQVIIDGSTISLSIQYSNPFFPDIKQKTIITFDTVLCYRYTTDCFTRELYDAYDTLVKIDVSQWLKEIKQMYSYEYNILQPKHYAVYIDSRGLYEFIAKDYEVREEKDRQLKLLAIN